MSLNLPTPSEIQLNIPEELLVEDKGLNLPVLNNRKLVGLLGFAKSGKDTVADYLVSNYGYKKVKFGDILKHTLNEHFKELVMENLMFRGVPISFSEMDFLVEDDRVLKEKLRPYMIWLGETLREKNGVHFWINKALEKAGDAQKIVVADIRREDELDLFRTNNYSVQRLYNSYGAANMVTPEIIEELDSRRVSYETNLFSVNQYGLEDSDEITVKAVLTAEREWLIEDTVYIDSRISDEGDHRQKFLESVSKRLAGKHGL